MILYITDAKYLQDYQIWLKFNNGKQGVVDLSQELTGIVFEPLQDINLFDQVKVDKDLDTIVWPNGADLAPEFLYGLLKHA